MFSIFLVRSITASSCQDCVVSFYSTFAFNKYFNWQTSKLQPAIVLQHVEMHARNSNLSVQAAVEITQNLMKR